LGPRNRDPVLIGNFRRGNIRRTGDNQGITNGQRSTETDGVAIEEGEGNGTVLPRHNNFRLVGVCERDGKVLGGTVTVVIGEGIVKSHL
jgi:hypothetical protein